MELLGEGLNKNHWTRGSGLCYDSFKWLSLAGELFLFDYIIVRVDVVCGSVFSPIGEMYSFHATSDFSKHKL